MRQRVIEWKVDWRGRDGEIVIRNSAERKEGRKSKSLHLIDWQGRRNPLSLPFLHPVTSWLLITMNASRFISKLKKLAAGFEILLIIVTASDYDQQKLCVWFDTLD